MAGRYTSHAVGLAGLMVLARTFTPEHFGVVALVSVVFTFGAILTESGLGPAIINLQAFSARDRDGVFTFTVLFGGVIAGLTYLGTPLLVAFYDEPRVALVMPWLATAMLFSAAGIVPLAHLNRDQRFILIGLFDSVTEVAATATSLIVLATESADPITALAMRMPIRTTLKWILVHLASRSTTFGMPKPGVALSGMNQLIGFSSFQFGFNLVNYFSRNLDNILVGRLLGAATLGIYEKTYQLMRYPLMLLTFAVAPAIQPVVRTLAHQPDEASRLHLKFTRILAYLGLAMGSAVVLGADLIVRVLLGAGWDSVVPVLRILALAIPVQVVLSTSGSFFQAMGNARTLFVSGLLSAVVMIAAISIGVSQGSLTTLAWLLVLAFHINFGQAYLLLHARAFMAPSQPFFRSMVPAAVGAAVLAMIVALGPRGLS